MSERIRLADMTLSQIRELKSLTAKIIGESIADIIKVLNEKCDVGDTDVEVFTNVDVIKDNYGDIMAKFVSYQTNIRFSNETD